MEVQHLIQTEEVRFLTSSNRIFKDNNSFFFLHQIFLEFNEQMNRDGGKIDQLNVIEWFRKSNFIRMPTTWWVTNNNKKKKIEMSRRAN